jgi:hypothetical protein
MDREGFCERLTLAVVFSILLGYFCLKMRQATALFLVQGWTNLETLDLLRMMLLHFRQAVDETYYLITIQRAMVVPFDALTCADLLDESLTLGKAALLMLQIMALAL